MPKKPRQKLPLKQARPVDPLARKQLAVSRRELATPIKSGPAVTSPKGSRAVLTPEQRKAKRREVAKRLLAQAEGAKTGFKQKYFTEEERHAANRQHMLKSRMRQSIGLRDIGHFDPSTIDWQRRLECKLDLERFDKVYMPGVFRLPWAIEHHRCNHKLQEVSLYGGKFCLAMRRAGGKTSISRGAVIWDIVYAHRTFPFFVGSKEPKAEGALRDIKVQFERNLIIQQDFPELCWPIQKTAEKGWQTRQQLYLGYPTHINWGTKQVFFPCLLLPKEIAQVYLDHDPDSLIDAAPFGYEDYWFPKSGFATIKVAGIDGSIRGESATHPITLEQPRPDLVIIDDVQKDQKAESLILRQKLITLIDGAIEGLAGPDKQIAAMMPCTVTCDGDASDTFVNPLIRPDWNGERCKRVTSWPPGITDYEITNDTDSGKLWNDYYQRWRSPFGLPPDATPAEGDGLPSMDQRGRRQRLNDFYSKHKKLLELNFEVGWPEAFPKEFVSAQQHAMEKRFATPDGFLAEDQQIGRKLVAEGEVRITAEQLQKKIVDFPQRMLPPETEILVAFLDIQTEVMFWSVFACDHNFNGVFVDYGTWPDLPVNYFTKAQTESWSTITRLFFEQHPHLRSKAHTTTTGKIRAPIEAKIYFALSNIVPILLSRRYVRADTHRKEFQIQKLGIDTRWGETSEVVKRYLREHSSPQLIGYKGQPFPPTNLQLEEYQRKKGWLFENDKHPNVKEPKWVLRPNESDGSWYLAADVNRLKDFLFSRLGSPQGSSGSISLFKATPQQHELFAHHITMSEYPEPVSARGLEKNQWKLRGTAYNNDYLDCAAGCMALASFMGASLKTTDTPIAPTRRRLSHRLALKRSTNTTQ